MINDHRPYFIKKAYLRFEKFYVDHFLRPQLESLGKGSVFVRPWNVEIFGSPIMLGDYANVIALSDARVRLSVWAESKDLGRIDVGSYCLICPGVRVSSASEVIIGDSCMLAFGVYITDSDWHDKYNRVTIGKVASVRIGENVWIGDGATICKGVTIGQNSIVGAGAVVVDNIPPNTIAAGNPAKVVKHLDPAKQFKTRAQYYSNPEQLFETIDRETRNLLKGNSLLHWFRHLIAPKKGE